MNEPRPAPRLTVICAAYRRPRQLPVLIHSFLAQTVQNFRLLIVHDGPDPAMEALLAPFKAAHPGVIDYLFTETRHDDYGHTPRQVGLDRAETEFVLLTNDDNYYCPVFVDYMFRGIDGEGADLALCDMIHSHDRPGGLPQPPYRPFVTELRRDRVDIGCFIVRTAMARRVGFRDKGYAGDATYLEDILRTHPGLRWVKLNHVLFVHN